MDHSVFEYLIYLKFKFSSKSFPVLKGKLSEHIGLQLDLGTSGLEIASMTNLESRSDSDSLKFEQHILNVKYTRSYGKI